MTQESPTNAETPKLLQRICDAENLPSLPAVALRVLQMTQSDDVSVNELAEVVGQDPVLTAKILKLVNSPLFGVSRKIISLPQAMVVLGLRTVKILVLSFSLVDSYGQNRLDWFDYKTYWRRSLTQAVAARLIAEQTNPLIRDEAFVAGLLCNLGILAMAQVARQQYATPYQQAGGKHALLLHAEQACLGFTHPEVAKTLFERWNLPKDVCLAVALHHQGPAADTDPQTARLVNKVYLSGWIADLFCDGATQENLDDLHVMAAQKLGLDKSRLDKILETLHQHVKQSADLMNVDIGQTISYEQLREQAVFQLAKLSVSSEVDLVAAQQREVESSKRQKDLEKAATTDALSKLANRAAFDSHVEQAFQRAQASQTPMGAILCDLDHFKRINDTYGHPVGDLIIAATGELLGAYRSDDIFVARYGGEEFVLVVSNCQYSRLVRLAEDISEKFRVAQIRTDVGTVEFNASLGAASTEVMNKPTAQGLIALTDKFLYMAKKRGRARACIAALPTKAAAPAAT